MAYTKVSGVVLLSNKVGDNDAILTVFTDSLGVIKISAKGIKSLKNKSMAGAGVFSYSEFVLRKGRGELYYLVSAELKMSFYSLSANIERLAFATYIADITSYAYSENEPEPRVLPLILNTFYLLANSNGELMKIKSVYELKLLSYLGFGASVDSCIFCGKKDDLLYFTNQGGTVCSQCKSHYPDGVKISKDALKAISYIIGAPDNKAFSFKISNKVTDEIASIIEQFFKKHIEKNFYSLSYLKTILGKDF